MFVATRYATQIRSSSNVLRFRSRGRSLFLTIGEEMEIGHFHYIDDQYFKDFPDSYLMQNKEKALKDKAGKVLALQRKGAKLIFPDVLSIEQELL